MLKSMRGPITVMVIGGVMALSPVWGILVPIAYMVRAFNHVGAMGMGMPTQLNDDIAGAFLSTYCGLLVCPIGLAVLAFGIVWIVYVDKGIKKQQAEMEKKRRRLSEGEIAVLKMIQVRYGSRNREEMVMFSDEDDAVIWVKDEAGSTTQMANLTNLAAWRADGTIPTDEDLLRNWLGVESH